MKKRGKMNIVPWDLVNPVEETPIEVEEEEEDILVTTTAEEKSLPQMTLPAELLGKLFRHQVYGVNWMNDLHNHRFKGGILAGKYPTVSCSPL
jgi:SNF2 family DNA or RNA helicase